MYISGYLYCKVQVLFAMRSSSLISKCEDVKGWSTVYLAKQLWPQGMHFAVFNDGAVGSIDICDSELSTEGHGERMRL
jgi:hypothetical protein